MNNLTNEELLRYSRQIMLQGIGTAGQEKIAAAKVLVVGAGGLGCPVLQYLCGAGVGTIGIVDFDRVEIHNLPRQILYNAEDIGKQKAPTAAEKLKKMNPAVELIAFDEVLNKSNIERIFAPFDIIIDGSDNFPTRYLINDWCVKLNKPLVYGSIFNFEGQFTVFNYKGSKNLRDLFPEPPNPEDAPGCNENGVLGTLPGIIGNLMAHETLKMILGMETIYNQLLIVDTRSWNFLKVGY
jgi:adenylyltransferase/sulfurtransferase